MPLKFNPISGTFDEVADISGKVDGPAIAVDDFIVTFDSTTGKLVKMSEAALQLANFGLSWGNNIPALVFDGTSVDAAAAFATGITNNTDGDTSYMIYASQDITSTAPSSTMEFFTGAAQTGSTGNSGDIFLYSGHAAGTATGNTGKVDLRSGNAANGNSGNVEILTGSAGTTRGDITLTSNNILMNATVSGTAIKDEDTMSSDSASHLATQQSIKAYVDAKATGDLWSDPVDADILSDVHNTRDLGSSANRFALSYAVTAISQDVELNLAGSTKGKLTSTATNTPSGTSAISSYQSLSSNNLAVFSPTRSAGSNTGALFLETGNADTTGNTGNINIQTGSVAAGTRGSVTVDALDVALNGTVSGTAIKDEDTMSSDSATHLATQQSIKAYVDNEVVGAQDLAVVSKVNADSPYTALSTDYLILCNTTGGGITVNLPTASGITGKQYLIKYTDSGFANAVTVDGSGTETIDGALTTTLDTKGESLKIVSDGTNWQIIERNIPSEWIAYTPTGGWTAGATYTGFWKRQGDSIQLDLKIEVTGAITGSTPSVNLPTGLSIDTAKLTDNNDRKSFGKVIYHDDSANLHYWGPAAYNNSTSVIPLTAVDDATGIATGIPSTTAPITFTTSDLILITIDEMPISGWKG